MDENLETKNVNKEVLFYILLAVIIIIISVVIYLNLDFSNDDNVIIKSNDSLVSSGTNTLHKQDDFQKTNSLSDMITVEIVGAVLNPDVYRLKKDAKVNDLIISAGGMLREANQSLVNRLDTLQNGDKVVIPFRFDFNEYKDSQHVITRDDIGYEYEVISDEIQTGRTSRVSTSKKININTASKEELMTLSGIGTATANNIIEYRSVNRFVNLEDIMNVPRIGPKTFENIKDNITLR